ncbi:MAG: hypothetical protein U5K77_03585 [Candidatus Saccharibacteria bacterium]|nr:hypothetical protein [Candidatus Saccharibacteria bacterium]
MMGLTKQQLIGLFAGLIIVVGGVFAYMYFTGDDVTNQQNQEEQATTDNNDRQTPEPGFNPVDTEEVAYIATISGSDEDGEISGTIESDGQGSIVYKFTDNGTSSEMYVTPDGTYACQDGSDCVKFSNNNEDSANSASPFNPDRFNFNEEDYNDFRDIATYEGSSPCSSGTCDVWSYVDEDTNTDTTTYIDNSSNRIVRIESDEANSSFVIEYDYDVSVTITPPENAQDLSNVNGL